jgi:hypothetical protein
VSSKDRWFDDDEVPLVPLYAVTRGRTRAHGESFDLISVVVGSAIHQTDRLSLDPEHLRLLYVCRSPITVADLASEIDLPLGVVRVLLGDLRDRGLIVIRRPAAASRQPDARLLREVLNELRSL